jgi:hypothetical protein
MLFGTTVTATSLLTAGTAGADTEIGSGTQWATTGWVQEGFYSGENEEGEPDDPVYSWAYYIGGISWQAWTVPGGGGNYDKLTQDFWEGLLGTEAGTDPPTHTENGSMYVAGYGAAHYDGATEISTATGDGTCPQEADPPYIPCEESQANTNGHNYKDPIDYGYILYGSNDGYPPVYLNGAQSLTVLSGYIS